MKIIMLVCVKPENRGLTSAAPKNMIPRTVVAKSKNPIKITGKQNSALLFIGYGNLVGLQCGNNDDLPDTLFNG
jgi:hypothetical protein